MATIWVKKDGSTIQAAVDAALPGDEILVESGVYHEQVTINKNFLTLAGEDDTVLDGQWRLATGFTLTDTVGVTLRSLTIKNYTNDGVDILGSGVSNAVSHLQFLNIGGSAVRQDATATDSRVIRCLIDSANNGIHDLGSRLWVEDCRIRYCRTGILCDDGSVSAALCRNTVSFNVSGIRVTGVLAQIEENKLCRNRNMGISIAGSSCHVEGNEVLDTVTYDGINLMSYNTVRGNRVLKNGRYGIYAEGDNIITDNDVRENALFGLLLADTGNVVESNRLKGNGGFDLVRPKAQNTIRANDCEKSLPPWLCKGGACQASEEGDSVPQDLPDAAAVRLVPQEYPTISLAVEAAMPGDMIFVKRGVYREEVTVNKDHLIIVGEKGAMLDGAGRLNSAFILSGVSGTELRSFRIENYRGDAVAVSGGEGNLIIGVHIADVWNNGILLDDKTSGNRICESQTTGSLNGIYDNSHRLKIENCHSAYNGNFGMYCLGSETEITDTIVESNFDNGIQCEGGNVRIHACRVVDNLQDGIESWGDNIIVEASEISRNHNRGLVLLGRNALAKHNVLCENAVYGLFSSNQGGNRILGNRADNNDLYGISVMGKNVVTENEAHGNRLYDMTRIEITSVFHDNVCGTCLPPWLCGEGCLPTCDMSRRCGALAAAATILVPDDYETIQAAVDAALPGDSILVKSGAYHEQVSIAKNGIKLVGQGAVLDGECALESGFMVLDAFGVTLCGFTVQSYTDFGIIIKGESREITLSSLAAVNCNIGLGLEQSVINCRITGCVILGSGTNGIINRSANLCIEDCRLSYNASTAIVAYCDSVTIRRNTTEHNLGNGINSQVTGSAIISGNSVYRNRGTALTAYGVSVIRDNEVSHNYSNGIAASTARSIVEGNRVRENEKGGIGVYSGVLVSGNDVRDNHDMGLVASYSGNIVTHNTVFGNRYYDIVISQSGNRVWGNTCKLSVPPWVCEGPCGQDDDG